MPYIIRRLDLSLLPYTFTSIGEHNNEVALPDFPVLYIIFNNEDVFYVGATRSLFNRFSGLKSDHRIDKFLRKSDTKIAWIAAEIEQLTDFELALISFLNPRLNLVRQGKTYHYNGTGNGRKKYLRLQKQSNGNGHK